VGTSNEETVNIHVRILFNRNFTLLQAYVSRKDEGDKVIVFLISNLVFAFNFHHTNSFTDYQIGVEKPGKYRIALDSDDGSFGGHDRLQKSSEFISSPEPQQQLDGQKHSIQIYLPNRTALVLALQKWESSDDSKIHIHLGSSLYSSNIRLLRISSRNVRLRKFLFCFSTHFFRINLGIQRLSKVNDVEVELKVGFSSVMLQQQLLLPFSRLFLWLSYYM